MKLTIKVFVIAFFVACVSSCKTKEASCDAYTNINQVENEIS
tara:strand:+ start:2217 stop:2342 length:126 start_codon:yes stop_codon:yes gene_type:complete